MKPNYLKERASNLAIEEILLYPGINQDYLEENSIIRYQYEEKRSPTHRSTYSMDEFKLKSLTTPSRPSHKRTISGTHAYFTELGSFGNKPPLSNSEISQESTGNCSLSKFSKNQTICELQELDEPVNDPKEIEAESQIDFPEQDSPIGFEEFEDMIEIITKKETELSETKHKKLKLIKEILLGRLKKSVSFDSSSFPKNELLSTERLSDLIRGSFASNHTQIGPGSSILLNEPSMEAPEYNNFLKGISKKATAYSNLNKAKNNLDTIENILSNICQKNKYEINDIKQKILNAKWAKTFVVIFNDCENADEIGVYGKEFINYRKIDGSEVYPENVFKPQIESELVLDGEDNQLREIESDEEADAIVLYKS